jgi:hypothetical protein
LRWAINLLTVDAVEDQVGLNTAGGWRSGPGGRPSTPAPTRQRGECSCSPLYAAGRADDADLRAYVLADLAAHHHHHLGHVPDCLQLARLGEVDKRVSPPVRMLLHG